MRLDPVIGALWSAPAPQRQAQAAMEAARRDWMASVAAQSPLEQLAGYGDGVGLADLPDLSAIVGNVEAADIFVTGLVRTFAGALHAEPLGLVPFRHQTSDRHVVLELARAGRAALSLMVYRPAAPHAPQSVCLTSGERHEICLRGEAEAQLVEATCTTGSKARFAIGAAPISRGWATAFDNARQSKIVASVARPLVILRLQRDLSDPLPVREYRLEDGALIHESAADRGDSRKELALTLLGAMGRKDALPVIAEVARTGPAHVRWEAVRQGLALDSAAGFAVLSKLAADAADPLAAPAAALRSQLVETYPQLRQIQERAACPA